MRIRYPGSPSLEGLFLGPRFDPLCLFVSEIVIYSTARKSYAASQVNYRGQLLDSG